MLTLIHFVRAGACTVKMEISVTQPFLDKFSLCEKVGVSETQGVPWILQILFSLLSDALLSYHRLYFFLWNLWALTEPYLSPASENLTQTYQKDFKNARFWAAELKWVSNGAQSGLRVGLKSGFDRGSGWQVSGRSSGQGLTQDSNGA